VTRARAAGLLALGFALGGTTALWNLGRARRGAEPEPSARAVVAVAAARPTCPDSPERAARAARVKELSSTSEALFQDNLHARFRQPENLPVRFSGRAIEEALHGAIAAAGVQAEILGTDCNEYPCMTTARTRSAADMQKIKDHFFDQPAYAGDIKQLGRARSDGPEEYRFGATIYPAGDARRGEIFAALTRRMGVARLGPGSMHPEVPPFAPDTLGAGASSPRAP
jgi:hypothetical protein